MSFHLSIVIPTWNGWHLLEVNLPSVLAAARRFEQETGQATEIIVVDDGSSDPTVERLPVAFPEVRLVALPRNRGFAGACNAGLAHCRYPVVALLNNDVRLDSGYFLPLTGHFRDPQVFAVTSRVFEWQSSIFAAGGRVGRFRRGFWSVYFNYDVRLETAADWVEGGRLLSVYAVGGFATYDRRKLTQLEGFNELLSPFHWEDVDLSYRAWKRGWEVRYEPRSRAFHRTSSTIGSVYRPDQVETVAIRNRLLFHWINLHQPSYMASHLLWLTLLVVSRWTVADTVFYRALGQALRRLADVRRRRRRERQLAARSDGQVAALLEDFYRSAPIQIYYNREEIRRRHPASVAPLPVEGSGPAAPTIQDREK